VPDPFGVCSHCGERIGAYEPLAVCLAGERCSAEPPEPLPPPG
jgi:hypothetical protein